MKLRCWITEGLEGALISLLCGGVFTAIALISKGVSHAILTLPHYTLFGGVIISMMLMAGTYLTDLPMHLALGSTRKNVKIGLHLMLLLLTVGNVLLVLLLCLLLPSELSRDLLPLLPEACLLMLSLGKIASIAGCLSLLHPKAGRAISTTLIFLSCGASGGFVGAFAAGDNLLEIRLSLSAWVTCLFAVFLALLTAIELHLQGRLLKTYEVRL